MCLPVTKQLSEIYAGADQKAIIGLLAKTFHSIGASHQVSIHLAEQLPRRRFLEIDQSETRMACGDHVY
jgi:hypothetical protein